jgi:hypothetical protein
MTQFLSINNRVDSDLTKDIENMANVSALLGALREAHNISITKGSFADSYIKAVNNRDFAYLRKAHGHIASLLEEDKERCSLSVLNFIQREPPAKLIYKSPYPYDQYYHSYINWIKKLDPNSVQDGMHWIELTDDEGVKRAYDDGLSPEELAKHVLANTSIDKIR